MKRLTAKAAVEDRWFVDGEAPRRFQIHKFFTFFSLLENAFFLT
jgi:hypothetical protein